MPFALQSQSGTLARVDSYQPAATEVFSQNPYNLSQPPPQHSRLALGDHGEEADHS